MISSIVIISVKQAQAIESSPQISLKYTKSIKSGKIANIKQLFTADNRVVAVVNENEHLTLLNFTMDDNKNIALLSNQQVAEGQFVYDISVNGEWLLFAKKSNNTNVIDVLHWEEESKTYQVVSSDHSLYPAPRYIWDNQSPVLFSGKNNRITAVDSNSSNESYVSIFDFDTLSGGITRIKTYTSEDNNIFDSLYSVFLDESNKLIVIPDVGSPVIFEVNFSDYSLLPTQALPVTDSANFQASYDFENNQLIYGMDWDYIFQSLDFEKQTSQQIFHGNIPYSSLGVGWIKLNNGLLANRRIWHWVPGQVLIGQFIDSNYNSIAGFDEYSQVALMNDYVWVKELDNLSVYSIDRTVDKWSIDLIDTVIDGELTNPTFYNESLFDEESQYVFSVKATGITAYDLVNNKTTLTYWKELGLEFNRYGNVELKTFNNRPVVLFNNDNFFLLPYIDEQGQLKAHIKTLISNGEGEECRDLMFSPNSAVFSVKCRPIGEEYVHKIFTMNENMMITSITLKNDIFPINNILYTQFVDFWGNHACFIIINMEDGATTSTSHSFGLEFSFDEETIKIIDNKSVDSCYTYDNHRYFGDKVQYEIGLEKNILTLYDLKDDGTTNRVSEYTLPLSKYVYDLNIQFLNDNYFLITAFEEDNIETLKLFFIVPQTLAISEVELAQNGKQYSGATFIQNASDQPAQSVLMKNGDFLDVYQVRYGPKVNNLPNPLVLNEGANDVLLTQWVTTTNKNDSLIFSSDNLPTAIELTTEGLLKFNALEISSNSFDVKVVNTFDLALEFSINYTLNHKPEVTIDNEFWINPNDDIAINLMDYVSDPESHQITFNEDSLTEGLTLKANGMLSGSLANSGTYTNTIIAIDELGAKTEFTVVIQINTPPIHKVIPVIKSTSAESIKVMLNSYFSDADGHVLIYSTEGLPSELKVSESGILSGVIDHAGAYQFKLIVTDEFGLTSEENIYIVVAEKPSNSSGGAVFHLLLFMIIVIFNKKSLLKLQTI